MFAFPEACGGGANSYRGWGILKSWVNRYRDGGVSGFSVIFSMTELICLIESLLGRTVGWCVGRLLFLSCTVVVVEEG